MRCHRRPRPRNPRLGAVVGGGKAKGKRKPVQGRRNPIEGRREWPDGTPNKGRRNTSGAGRSQLAGSRVLIMVVGGSLMGGALQNRGGKKSK